MFGLSSNRTGNSFRSQHIKFPLHILISLGFDNHFQLMLLLLLLWLKLHQENHKMQIMLLNDILDLPERRINDMLYGWKIIIHSRDNAFRIIIPINSFFVWSPPPPPLPLHPLQFLFLLLVLTSRTCYFRAANALLIRFKNGIN